MHFDKSLDQAERRPVGCQDLNASRAVLFRLWGQIDAKEPTPARGRKSGQTVGLRVADRPSATIKQDRETDGLVRWRAEIEADNFEFWN